MICFRCDVVAIVVNYVPQIFFSEMLRHCPKEILVRIFIEQTACPSPNKYVFDTGQYLHVRRIAISE